MNILINLRRLVLTSLLLLIMVVPQANGATTDFTSSLTGDQEVPPVSTNAFGSALLRLNDAMDRLEILVSVFGLDFIGATPDTSDDITAFHIHVGAPGVNGPVVFGFISPNSDTDSELELFANGLGGTLSSGWDLDEGLGASLVDLFNGDLYFNVHTVGNPAGEIRGQIIPIPAAAWLFMFGLASIGLMGFRREKS